MFTQCPMVDNHRRVAACTAPSWTLAAVHGFTGKWGWFQPVLEVGARAQPEVRTDQPTHWKLEMQQAQVDPGNKTCSRSGDACQKLNIISTTASSHWSILRQARVDAVCKMTHNWPIPAPVHPKAAITLNPIHPYLHSDKTYHGGTPCLYRDHGLQASTK